MNKREALLIAEEILRMIVNNDDHTNSHFQETMHEYVCNRLDISDESLADALDIISKERDDKRDDKYDQVK